MFSSSRETRLVPGMGAMSSPLASNQAGHIHSLDDMDRNDWRRTNPRFMGKSFTRNVDLVSEVEKVATGAKATPAQVALG